MTIEENMQGLIWQLI